MKEQKKVLIKSWTREDFRVDTFRSGGKGGQHQNKTDSGVRITHIESGLFAECREHSSQFTNKKIAFNKLAYMLVEKYFPKSGKSKAPDKVVRNYHEPEDRIVDEFGNRHSYKESIVKGKASKMINSHTTSALEVKNESNE